MGAGTRGITVLLRLLVLAVAIAWCAAGCRDDHVSQPLPVPAGEAGDLTSASIADGSLRIVSRAEPLPPDYVPDLIELGRELAAPPAGQLLLTPASAAATVELLAAAAASGIELRVVAAFRNFPELEASYLRLVDRVGEARAALLSVPPGANEHQLGTVIDLSAAAVEWTLDERFAATREGMWLRDHAYEYGFALSYPPGGEAVTGSPHEPWHYRYVGREHAGRWRAGGQPLLTYLRSATR